MFRWKCFDDEHLGLPLLVLFTGGKFHVDL